MITIRTRVQTFTGAAVEPRQTHLDAVFTVPALGLALCAVDELLLPLATDVLTECHAPPLLVDRGRQVLWAEMGVTPDDVYAELRRREGVSGIAEKASRPK